MQLSGEQKAAVEHVGTPALVVAGAGSGKTRTLTAKITHLIKQGVEPDRILAITFTNKAAEEMKTRLTKLTGLPAYKFPWVRTYHSACYRILKDHCELLGYTKPIQIFSAYHQQKTFKDIVARMNFDKKHVNSVMSQISRAKNFGSPDKYFETNSRVSHIRLKDVYNMYEKELRASNAVDFDNILLLARDILRDFPEVRNGYREMFQYVMVDEYQDSNNIQEELTGLLLGHGNLFCVGDDWQSVYGFRGSNVNHFLSFPRKYENAQVFRLEQNFRSADEIVQVANDLIGYNEHRMDKRCFSDKRGGVVELKKFYNESEEAKWVARKIHVLKDMEIPLESIAVIYRTKALSLAFEKTFRAYKIPYQMMGSKGFFDRKEVLDLNCYLTAAVFPADDVAFERVINTPKRGIGPAMIKKIAGMREGDMSLQDAARKMVEERVLTPKVHKLLTELFEGLDDMKTMPPQAALNEAIERFNYMDYLKQQGAKDDKMGYTSRVENVEQLIYSASQKETITDYLEEAALIREDKDDDDEGGNNYGVNLSTVHSSKGLEYFVVFIVGCEEEIFPHWRSMDSSEEIQEERRLMYVAVTRAEKYLYLTRSQYRRGQPSDASRFIGEIKEGMD